MGSLKRFLGSEQTHFLSIALLALRLGGGGLMLSHGYPKLNQLLGSSVVNFPDPIGIGPIPSLAFATLAEFFCAWLLIAGLFTRYATIPLIITMAVAILVVHGGDPLSKIQTPLLYLTIYVTLFFTGPGGFSLDHILPWKR